jgi:hypothetical protein
MKRQLFALGVCVLVLVSILAGCQREAPKKGGGPAAGVESGDEADIKASLAKLSPEDRKLAEAQKFCAVRGKDSRLGSMGPPVKIMLKDEPVFLCCKNCTKKAEEHPDETLARAKEFKTAK